MSFSLANKLTERLETHFMLHFPNSSDMKRRAVLNPTPPLATSLLEDSRDAPQYREFGGGNSIRTVFIREQGF